MKRAIDGVVLHLTFDILYPEIVMYRIKNTSITAQTGIATVPVPTLRHCYSLVESCAIDTTTRVHTRLWRSQYKRSHELIFRVKYCYSHTEILPASINHGRNFTARWLERDNFTRLWWGTREILGAELSLFLSTCIARA